MLLVDPGHHCCAGRAVSFTAVRTATCRGTGTLPVSGASSAAADFYCASKRRRSSVACAVEKRRSFFLPLLKDLRPLQKAINMDRTRRWGVRRIQASPATVPCSCKEHLASCHWQLHQRRHQQGETSLSADGLSGSQAFPSFCCWTSSLQLCPQPHPPPAWQQSLGTQPWSLTPGRTQPLAPGMVHRGLSLPQGCKTPRLPTDNALHYGILEWCRQPRTIPSG